MKRGNIEKQPKMVKTWLTCFEGISPEFLLNCGEYALTRLAADIKKIGYAPHLHLKKAKIVAILKSGKSGDMPNNYRQMALLSSIYNLLERVIYNRSSLENIYKTGRFSIRKMLHWLGFYSAFIEVRFQKKIRHLQFPTISQRYMTPLGEVAYSIRRYTYWTKCLAIDH